MVQATLRADRQATWRMRQQLGLKSLIPLRALGPRHAEAFGILTYHRVSWQCRHDPGLLNVRPPTFRDQIEGLLAQGYEAWSLSRVIDCRVRGASPPRNAFVIVFDDGYENVFLNAWPVLRRLGAPATIFLATGFLGSSEPFPFDTSAENSDSSGESWRPLAIEQCHEMLDSGLIELGTHTHTHADFRRRPTAFERDMTQSLDLLQRDFGIERPAFSLPYGRGDDTLVEVARDLGVSCCLTTECQLVRPTDSPYDWGRFGATEFDTAATLAGKLDGWYSFLQNTWRGMRGVGS